MIVYIEDILFENFITFFTLILLVSKTLGLNEKLGRSIFASIVVSLVATLGVVVGLGQYGQMLLISLNLVLAILLSQKGIKKIFASIVLSITYLLVIDGVKDFLAKKLSVSKPFVLVILLVYVVLIFGLIRHFYSTKRHKKFEYKITFYNQNNVFSTIGYLDSGNFLEDSLSGKPIVIIDYNTFLHISGYSIEDLLTSKYNLKNSHYINYSTISGGQKMLVFDIDCVEIDGSKKDCHIGLNLKGFENGYSALLGVKVLGEGL